MKKKICRSMFRMQKHLNCWWSVLVDLKFPFRAIMISYAYCFGSFLFSLLSAVYCLIQNIHFVVTSEFSSDYKGWRIGLTAHHQTLSKPQVHQVFCTTQLESKIVLWFSCIMWLFPFQNFKTLVPPIPIFDKLNDTYSQGQV